MTTFNKVYGDDYDDDDDGDFQTSLLRSAWFMHLWNKKGESRTLNLNIAFIKLDKTRVRMPSWLQISCQPTNVQCMRVMYRDGGDMPFLQFYGEFRRNNEFPFNELGQRAVNATAVRVFDDVIVLIKQTCNALSYRVSRKTAGRYHWGWILSLRQIQAWQKRWLQYWVFYAWPNLRRHQLLFFELEAAIWVK